MAIENVFKTRPLREDNSLKMRLKIKPRWLWVISLTVLSYSWVVPSSSNAMDCRKMGELAKYDSRCWEILDQLPSGQASQDLLAFQGL